MGKKELRAWKISPALFDKILTDNAESVVAIKDLALYKAGTRLHATIYYDGIKQLVLSENLVTGSSAPDWYQCIAILDNNQRGLSYKRAITGGTAWRMLKAKLLRYYTEPEFVDRLRRFSADYDERVNQMHFAWYASKEDEHRREIHRFGNCRKYDINGAYASALIEIFPKAKDEILKLYLQRKDKPINKDVLNFFVGMLCRTGFRGTYNYIVQAIRRRMDDVVDKAGGILLYANTDGFVVAEPDKLIETGTGLGAFKQEYAGAVYIYEGANYWMMQAGSDKKGSALWQVRDLIDLELGQVVRYKRVKDGYTYHADNVETFEVNIHEESC